MVVDASAVAAALGPSQAGGDWAAAILTGARLAAPRLMPFEAGSVFRKMQLAGIADATSAGSAHRDLLDLDVELWPHRQLADRAWALKENIGYYDACYVALAELLDAPLVTLDRRLSRASGPRCQFLVPPP